MLRLAVAVGLAACEPTSAALHPGDIDTDSYQLYQVKTGADGKFVCLDPDPGSMEGRSAAVAATLRVLRDEGFISGWRDELYPVVGARLNDAPALLVERAAAPFLGVKAYGVHMNGYVRKPDGLHIWVATRSRAKPTWPGKLDHLAAGGQV